MCHSTDSRPPAVENPGSVAEEGLIDRADLDLITFVESAEEGVAAIRGFYGGMLPCPVEEPPPV